ncbi:hypothetical protein LPJ68_005974, partial [Coemansia sp. RSA 1086]
MEYNNEPVDIAFLKTNTILNQEWQHVPYYIECNGRYYRSTSEGDMSELKESLEADSSTNATVHTEMKIPVYLSFAANAINKYATCESTFGWLKDEVLNHYFNGVEFNANQYGIQYGTPLVEMCNDDKIFTVYEPSTIACGLLSSDGMGLTFQTNVFGHYLLIHKLEFAGGAWVIWTGSAASRLAFSYTDFMHVRGPWPYESSKFVIDQIAIPLDNRLSRKNVRCL